MNYNFSVYLHTNQMNDIPAKVAKYSFEKHNPGLEIYIEYLENHPNLLEYHNASFFRGNSQLTWDTSKHQSFFPIRFLCGESHINARRNHKWILVIDPDVFCLKDLSIFNSYIEQAENENKSIIAWNKNSSVMLINTEESRWTEASLIQKVFIEKQDFNNWMFLQPYSVVELPKKFNEYDIIKPDTILLHTTNTETQPWKTGIRYQAWELHNQPYNPNSPTLEFKNHPNPQVKSFVFELFKEAYEHDLFTLDEVESSINNRALRPDIIQICNLI